MRIKLNSKLLNSLDALNIEKKQVKEAQMGYGATVNGQKERITYSNQKSLGKFKTKITIDLSGEMVQSLYTNTDSMTEAQATSIELNFDTQSIEKQVSDTVLKAMSENATMKKTLGKDIFTEGSRSLIGFPTIFNNFK